MTRVAASAAHLTIDDYLVDVAMTVFDCYPHQLHDNQAHELELYEVAQILVASYPQASIASCISAARLAHFRLGRSITDQTNQVLQ
jgi:hypothetical protein